MQECLHAMPELIVVHLAAAAQYLMLLHMHAEHALGGSVSS
jgi:hypothetical protein